MKKAIVNGLKKMLDSAKGKWADELPNVLWAYQTMPRRSTGETPFSMTFGTKAMILVEVGLLSMRTADFSSSANDAFMIDQLDFMEENREIASIRLVNYQQKLSWGYNRNVRPREFIIGDLVL